MAGTPEFAFVRRTGDGSTRTFVAGRGHDFRIRTRELEQSLGARLPARIRDLVDIATAIYVSDRSTKRYHRSSDGVREFQLAIDVRDPSFWRSREMRRALEGSVEFLTRDDWKFRFSRRDRSQKSDEFQPNLFENENSSGDSVLVSLYSGGLDSAAGLAHRLRQRDVQRCIPVTVWHQSQQRSIVQDQLIFLRQRYGCEIDPKIVKVAMTAPSKLEREETTQRARALLFCSVGGAVAVAVGSGKVEIFESGIGAANVPLMAGMVGWKTTRGAHPEYLRRVSNLVSLVAGEHIIFTLPFIQQTKAEVVRAVAGDGLGDLFRMTNSCVRFPLHESGAKSCGICPACILRRQALLSSDVEDPSTQYKYDFMTAPQMDSLPYDGQASLNSIQLQAVRMASMAPGRPAPNWLRSHLIGTGIADASSLNDWLDLFARYGREWLALNPQCRICSRTVGETVPRAQLREVAHAGA